MRFRMGLCRDDKQRGRRQKRFGEHGFPPKRHTPTAATVRPIPVNENYIALQHFLIDGRCAQQLLFQS
jgi:hypothetical protein